MASAESHQLPSSIVAKEFGEVNVRRAGPQVEITFTILMEPQGSEAEGWQTGVALDGSASMKKWYGRELTGKIPPELAAEYEKKGWITARVEDKRKVKVFQREAYEDAIQRGHLKLSTNIVEPQARQFISYLAGNLDADGGTTVIYWACGDGGAIDVLGDFTEAQCQTLALSGPKTVAFGAGTKLKPAVEYFVDRFRDAARGMYVFITDGKLDDLEQVKTYTTSLCREIAAGRRNPVKCVLVGVGESIDEAQMEQLDDLESGTDVDVWDHKIAKEMRNIIEIFAEVVSENQLVAATARIFAPDGQVVKNFADGLPAKASFSMPAGFEWFELEVAGQRIRQPIVAPVR